MSINRWMDRQNVVHPHNGMLFSHKKEQSCENSLAVRWLGLCTSTVGGRSSIPGWGAKSPQTMQCGKKKRKKKKDSSTGLSSKTKQNETKTKPKQKPRNGVVTRYDMGEPWEHYAAWKKPDWKVAYCVIPFMWNIQKRQIHRDRK